MHKPSWDMNKFVTEEAEEYGFAFAFSMVKSRGYGGDTQFWDWAHEPFTLMAGRAAVTDGVRIISSVALPTLHPAMAARRATAIDDITGGRGRCGVQGDLHRRAEGLPRPCAHRRPRRHDRGPGYGGGGPGALHGP